MTPERFLEWAKVLPEPFCLVSGDGHILACHPSFAAIWGLPSEALCQKSLFELTTEPPDRVKQYLRACSQSGQLQLGSFTLRLSEGPAPTYICEGAIIEPCLGEASPIIFLRLKPKESADSKFLTLNEKAEILTREARARQEIEEKAREQQERFRVTLASIGDGVIATDEQGQITFMNPVAESLTGWPDHEAIGRPLAEVFHIINEDTLQEVESPITTVLREGTIVGLANHTVLVAKDGVARAIDDSGAPIKDANGQITGTVLVFHDITERRRAEVAQLKLSAIVESSDDAIISQTLEGVITSWNQSAERIYGYSAHEVLGQPASLLLPPDRAHEASTILQRIKHGERIEHYETVRRRKDGTLIDVSLTVSPIKDSEGRIIGASKIARDITEKKQIDAQRAYLAAIVASSNDAIVSKTLESVITSWNQAAEKMFGYTAAEAIGQKIYLIIPRERHEEETQIIEKLKRGERIEHFETVRRRKDGTLIDVSLTISPIKDSTGRIIGASKIARDITDKKHAEVERQQLLEREQTARARAEEASRLKDEFLAIVSHELRTPLNAILGWSQLLRNQANPEQAHRAAEIIYRNAKSQAQIIEDLLDVSRMITGKLRLDVHPIDLASIIEAALDSVRPAADAKGLRIQTMLDSGAGPVSGDASRLQQVVWNLLSNAIKFTPKGGRVQVRLERINSHIEIVVSDTGQGIKPEFLPHVFDRFRQADSSSTRSFGGLGLGLSIVRHLVELHGGIVLAHSPGEGQGATFIVRLPIMVVHSKPDENRVHPKVESGELPTLDCPDILTGTRVLIVDDEMDTSLLLMEVLKRCGAEVRTCSSAKEGLREVKTWHPTVIVSDIGMPEEDGYTFIRKVRAWEQPVGRRTPAIALTAYARAEDRIRSLSAGYQTHITKPIEPMELVLAVAGLAGGQEQ